MIDLDTVTNDTPRARLIKQVQGVPDLYDTDGEKVKYAYMHFYNLKGRGDWYVLEAQELEDDDYYFFGYVKSPITPDFDEYGYFTLKQLQEANFIVFDTGFKKTLLSELI